jgi:predicted pyridoxine 5'-phosphate oxidase superfamily flavin-nucleotide-binding protein
VLRAGVVVAGDRPLEGVFHAGEEAVQRRAGVFEQAARLGPRMVRPELDDDLARFLAAQPFVVVASLTADGSVWCSMLIGPPGFARAVAPGRVVIAATPDAGHPLGGLPTGERTPVGLLVLDPTTRGRIRINGTARRVDGGIEIAVREAFGNCPKHIQRREPVAVDPDRRPGRPVVSEALDAGQRRLILEADTLFVASRHPERGADASHRGGCPGFVVPSDDGRGLTFPDYAGNAMFQTLGNLTVDPAVGLLVVDWDDGRALHLTGRATVVWDDPRLADWPGAQRLVDVEIVRVVDRPGASPLTWRLVEAHRLNPEVPQA